MRARVLLTAVLSAVVAGCATPNVRTPTGTTIVGPDGDDGMGGSGIESADIRTIASSLAGSLLSHEAMMVPDPPVRVAIAPIRNSTRFIIDKELFSKRLRIELNRSAQSRIRFFSQGQGQETRRTMFQNQDSQRLDAVLSEAAQTLAVSSTVVQAREPLMIAVVPVKNTGLVGMSADPLTAMLRSKISTAAGGKIQFLAREKSGKAMEQIIAENDLKNLGVVLGKGNSQIAGVDYFLGGEFIGDTLITSSPTVQSTQRVGINADDPREISATQSVKTKAPNVAKYLNVMLINAETGAIPVERLIQIERKMTSGIENATYILTGELSGLSKASAAGDRSDYVMMTFQLIDPNNNEILWEDAYETKKTTRRSVLYK